MCRISHTNRRGTPGAGLEPLSGELSTQTSENAADRIKFERCVLLYAWRPSSMGIRMAVAW